jgi:hypothetical protein
VIPDVPFVEGNRHLPPTALARPHDIDGRGDGVNVVVELVVEREVVGGVSLLLIEIHVKRDMIHRVICVFENDAFPFRIGCHVGIG